MARKVQDPSEATTVVNVADFQRTRDSVIVALATLQSSVQDLSRAYINHANTVLNPGRGGALDANLTNILTESGLIGGPARMQAQDLQMGVEEPATGEKKKRKRAKHDPNAPKRALTPYFLYMQSARSMIATELGEHAKPKEVADEGTRRWGEMKPEEKAVWDDLYQKNLAAYRVRMAAYKAGQEVPTEADALRLIQAGKGPELVAVGDIDDDAEAEEEDDSTPEPAKEPTPPTKSNKRRKVEKAAPSAEETPKPAAKSPEKKSKKSKKEASPPPAAPASSKASEKKSKKSKKSA